MWLFFTLLAAFLAGIGQVFIKKGLQETTPLFNNVLGAAFTLLLMIPFSLIGGVHFDQLLSIFPLTLFFTTAYLSYYYIVNLEQISLSGTTLAAYPVITVILSFIFLHENPHLLQKAGIICVLLGTIFIALPKKKNLKEKSRIGSWFWWAIFGAISVGIGDFLSKVGLNMVDSNTFIFAYAISFALVVIPTIIFDKKGKKIPKFTFKKYIPTLIGVSMLESAVLAFIIAASLGFISLVSPLSSTYVIITVILARIFLKEKVTKEQFIGILFSATGILLIGA